MPESEAAKEFLEGLSDRQRAFCFEYLKCDCNATRAAIAAGYSKKGIRVAAHRLLTNANIRAAISALLRLKGYAPEFCKCKLGAYATADIAVFEKWLTGEKSLEDLQNEGVDTSLIKSATTSQTMYGKNRKLALYDAQRAVETLAKIHGLFSDRGDPQAGGAPEGLEVTRQLVVEEYRRQTSKPIDLGIPGLQPLPPPRRGGPAAGDNGGDGEGQGDNGGG